MLSYSDQSYLGRIERRISALEEALVRLERQVDSYVLALREIRGMAGLDAPVMSAAMATELEKPPDAA